MKGLQFTLYIQRRYLEYLSAEQSSPFSHLAPKSVLGPAILVPVGVHQGQQVDIQVSQEGGEGAVAVVHDVPQYSSDCGRGDPFPCMDSSVCGRENF